MIGRPFHHQGNVYCTCSDVTLPVVDLATVPGSKMATVCVCECEHVNVNSAPLSYNNKNDCMC